LPPLEPRAIFYLLLDCLPASCFCMSLLQLHCRCVDCTTNCLLTIGWDVA
jgi:hypothetical protein